MLYGPLRLAAAFAFIVLWPAVAQSTITFSPVNPKPGEKVTFSIVTYAVKETNISGVNVGATTIGIQAIEGYNFCGRDLTLVGTFTAPARPGIYDVEYTVTSGSEHRLLDTAQLAVSSTCDLGHSLTAGPQSVFAGDPVTLTWCDPAYFGVDAGYYVNFYRVYASASPSGPFTAVADVQGHTVTQTQVKPSATTYYYVESHGCQGVVTMCGAGAPDTTMLSNIVAVNVAGTGASCLPNAATLCFLNGRFAIGAHWTTADGRNGDGRAVALSDHSGYFWFFDSGNIEVTTKIVDACQFSPPAFWFFAAGMTNVRVDLTVTDTQSHVTKTYSNTQGNAFAMILDATTFSCR